MGTSLLGGPYAQGAPALKMMQKRYVGLHQWLSPMCATKDLKEHLVSVGAFVSVHCSRTSNLVLGKWCQTMLLRLIC